MSTVQTWTLWQRMPPRYQLTSRFYDEDADDLPVEVTPEKLPSARSSASSRPTSGIYRQQPKTQISTQRPPSDSLTPRKQTKLVSSQDEGRQFMVSSRNNNAPETVKTDQSTDDAISTSSHSNKFSFPRRQSEYVSHFQKQKRVNSARRRLAESPPTPTVGASLSAGLTSPRAQTAPVYPVTNPESYATHTIRFNDSRRTASTSRKPQRQEETTKIDMFQFDDAKSASATPVGLQKSVEKQPKPKKYLIQDTNKSTMYIDNGKVICFGKSRHDLTQLLKTQSLRRDRNRCFFSELRRDYLTHPKYDINRNKDKRDNDPRRVAYERIDYNRKVENILNYYSDDEGSQSPSPPNSRPSSRYRVRSPKGGRYKGLTLTASAPSRPPSRAESPIQERDDGFGDFIKLNKQSTLYDRKFYLRTPMLKHDGYTQKELENCRCSICRIEMQLSIVTGVNKAAIHGTDTGHERKCVTNGKNGAKAHHDIARDNQNNVNDIKANGNDRNEKSDKSSQLRVSFKQPDSEETVQEQQHTLTISCTLPEVTDLAQSEVASESGFESSRTVISVAQTANELGT